MAYTAQGEADRVVELEEALGSAEEALQWASGSADFNVGGKARRGWLRLGRSTLLRISAALAARKA